MIDAAQTNLQLFEQLIGDGVGDEQLELIARSYDLAMQLCTGMYRPNGKPFVCHLVGTASILHHVGAPIEMVAAGLLHSVYSHGDFGRATGSVTRRKRKAIRSAVGREIEQLVYRYAKFEWDHGRMDEMRDRLPKLSEEERAILLMRLADHLDDHVDMGRLYERSAAREVGRQERRDAYSSLAREAGYPKLADEMDRISDRMSRRPVRERMIFDKHGRSYSVPPRSYRRRLPASAVHATRNLGSMARRLALATTRGSRRG